MSWRFWGSLECLQTENGQGRSEAVRNSQKVARLRDETKAYHMDVYVGGISAPFIF